MQRGYFRERYEGHANSVYSVAFSPDGKTLASASLDMTLKLWDMNGTRSRNRCRTTFTGHSDFVLSVAFSYDGKVDMARSDFHVCPSDGLLFSSSFRARKTGQFCFGNRAQQRIRLFCADIKILVRQCDLLWVLTRNSAIVVISVATSPVGNGLFATGSGDKKARIWRYDA